MLRFINGSLSFRSVLLACLLTVTANAATEEARVETQPWSGYWWPISKGELIKPLAKYDSVVGSQAAEWEIKNKPPGTSVPHWFGYCHAWAASAILELEPTGKIQVGAQRFGVGDQKGLLAACHADDVANSFGDRFGDGIGSEDPSDLPPEELWMLLRRHIGEQGVPLILDIEAGEEVWNYPVFAYRVDYEPTGNDDELFRGTLSIWMADDAVPKNYVGLKQLLKRYQFEVRMREGSVIMGSGRWLGTSQQNHPDFAWFPYVVRPENPEIQHSKVSELLASSHPPAAAPTTNDSSTPEASNTATTEVGSAVPVASGGSIPEGEAESVHEDRDDDQPESESTRVTNETCTESMLIDPIELVSLIVSKTSDFQLDITVDRFDGGRYLVDDQLSVAGRSARDGFLYLFAVNTNGIPSLLYPQPGDDNRVAAGKEFGIPTQDASYRFRLHRPVGDYRVKAIVCEKKLEFSGLVVDESAESDTRDSAGDSANVNDFAVQKQSFRWNPTQQNQIQQLLTSYSENGSLEAGEMDRVEARTLLGAFAQDEVVFYLGEHNQQTK